MFNALWDKYITNLAERNAIITSVAFFLIFTAFGSAQNFATSRDKKLGSESLGTLYGLLTVSNFVAPILVKWMGPSISMFVGALTYTGYLAANVKVVDWVLITASAIEGIGAATLWTAQGAFIAKCAHEKEHREDEAKGSALGTFNGIFWMFMMGNQFIGNLLVALLFQFTVSETMIYIILGIVCIIGCFTFCLIRPFPPHYNVKSQPRQDGYIAVHDDSNRFHVRDPGMGSVDSLSKDERLTKNMKVGLQDENDSDDEEIADVSIWGTLRMWTNPNLLRLVFLTIYNGSEQEFIYGEFPTLIEAKNQKFYALAFFGFCDMSFSIFWGKISDKSGRLSVLFFGLVSHIIVYTYLWIFDPIPQSQWETFFILGFFLGCGDAALNTQLSSLYAQLLGQSPETFANFKLFQALSTMYCFLYSPYLTIKQKIIGQIIPLVLGALLLFTSKNARLASTGRYKLPKN